MLIDIYNRQRTLENTLKKMDDFKMSSHNKKLIKKFYEHLETKNIGAERKTKYIRMMRDIGEKFSGGKPFEKMGREDIIRMIGKIKATKFSGWTKHDYMVTLRQFFIWLEDDMQMYGDLPFVLRKARAGGSSASPIDSSKLYTDDEIDLLIKNTGLVRDKAIICLLKWSGIRVGELVGLNVGDVRYDNDGYWISVTGKVTGVKTRASVRRVRVAHPTPIKYIKLWLEEHPNPDEPESPLFLTNIRLGHPNRTRLGYRAIYDMLKAANESAKIKKEIHPHLLRHTRASELAKKKFVPEYLKRSLGHAKGSKVTEQFYLHFLDEDVGEEIDALEGGRSTKVEKMNEVLIDLFKTNKQFKSIVMKEIERRGEDK